MPLFEYRCKSCGKNSEQLVIGSRKPICPHCGSKKLEKQFSSFSAKSSSSSCSTSSCGTSACSAQGGGCSGGTCPFSP